MQVRVRYQVDRDSVPVVVSGGGGDEEPPDDLAARRRFNALIAPHLSALRVRASQLCRSNYDADDVVQESLLRAFLTRSQVKDLTRARAWLLTILTRTFIDCTRKRRRQPDHVQLVDDVPEPVPIEPSPWNDIGVDDLRAAIERLPDDVRDTYRMFALDGGDYATISEAQGIPTATVGSRIFRARKQLRVLLTAAAPPGKALDKGSP
jgi:RNA polymerase sigma-70 factor (ECF subfamily)